MSVGRLFHLLAQMGRLRRPGSMLPGALERPRQAVAALPAATVPPLVDRLMRTVDGLATLGKRVDLSTHAVATTVNGADQAARPGQVAPAIGGES